MDHRTVWVNTTALRKGDVITLRDGRRCEVLDNCFRVIVRLCKFAWPVTRIDNVPVWDIHFVTRDGVTTPVRMTTSQRNRHDTFRKRILSTQVIRDEHSGDSEDQVARENNPSPDATSRP